MSPHPPDLEALDRLGVTLALEDVEWIRGGRRRASVASAGVTLFVALANTLLASPAAAHSLLVLQFPWLSPAAGDPVRAAVGRRQADRLHAFEHVLCYSEFVAACIRDRFPGSAPRVIAPPVTLRDCEGGRPRGQNVVAVGRFFAGDRGNNKKHAFMIDAWRRLMSRGLGRGWTLHLAGGMRDDIRSHAYLRHLRRRAAGLPVRFHVNAPRERLNALYDDSAIFWHATGVGETQPERFEHFGITTVEAMAAGCVPVVVGLGGQAEIVSDGVTGRLWWTEEELIAATVALMRDPVQCETLGDRAREAARNYGRACFNERVDALICGLR